MKPLARHIKYAKTEAAKIGGSVRVHETHITLFNVNGDIVGYYHTHEDHIAVYLTFEYYKKS